MEANGGPSIVIIISDADKHAMERPKTTKLKKSTIPESSRGIKVEINQHHIATCKNIATLEEISLHLSRNRSA
jgi:hypothetical protein